MPHTLDHDQLSKRFPDHDQPAAQPAAAIAWLNHEAVASISGKDAARFLQGQVTCDVNSLALHNSILGARCNPKGRMQSSFRLLREADDSYLLSMDRELLTPQLADLGKYAVFFKVSMQDVSDNWLRLGLWGEQAAKSLSNSGFEVPKNVDSYSPNDKGLVLRLPDNAFELWLPASNSLQTLDELLQHATPASLEAWRLRQIRAGIGQVCAATRESFIPQMLNLQHLGGVSFRKGCYTGQEIVARMQYLGKLKRRMYRVQLSAGPLPEAGSPILDQPEGKPIGEVVMAAQAQGSLEMLAVLQKDAAQLGTLRLADSPATLTLAELPYESQLADGETD